LYTWQIIGVTANTLQDCETLISKIVDYIGLGPFRINTSKNQLSPALGLNGYTAIAEALKTNTPIIGFGGIIIKDVKAILETGIPGIGVSDAITKDFNTIRTFNQLLNASSTDEQRHTFK
jgi:thiamine-phosphate pyrophosphorylase